MPRECLNVDKNPPYILDLDPSNSFLFLNLERRLKKRKCSDVIARSAEHNDPTWKFIYSQNLRKNLQFSNCSVNM